MYAVDATCLNEWLMRTITEIAEEASAKERDTE
jgi:hypothetical protein